MIADRRGMMSEFGVWALTAAGSGTAAVATSFASVQNTTLTVDTLIPAGVVLALFGVAVTASVKMTRLYMSPVNRIEALERDKENGK